MRIYNFLFYKTYLLAKRSRNFDDSPVLGGLIYVTICLSLNFFTIVGLLEAIGYDNGIDFKKEYKYPFGLILVILLFIYYNYKGRYKKIIEKYESKNQGKAQVHPVIVIIIYYGLSFGLLLLTGMYKNHDWIFAR